MVTTIKDILVLAMIGLVANLAQAGPLDCGHGQPCPKKVCNGEVEIKKEKKHCWEVETKDICIPRVHFPWSKWCKPLCGKVRTVKVLKKKTYEVEKCGCKWKIEEVCDDSCTPACIDGAEIIPAPAGK